MFIVQKNEASSKTVRMPNVLIEQLEEIAADEDISFNQLVVQCCEYALANLPKSDGKISCTEQFLKKKKQYKTAFIKHMAEASNASEQSLSQMFTDAIFPAKSHNAELGIDLYDILCGKIGIEDYRLALERYFAEGKKKNPAALARDYANAARHLKEFVEQADLL